MSAKPIIQTFVLRFVAAIGWITMDVCVCWNHTRVARKRNLRPYRRWQGGTVFTQLMSISFSFCPSFLLYGYVKRINSELLIWKKHFLFVKRYCRIPFERFHVICFENICFMEVWNLLCRSVVVYMGNLLGNFAGHSDNRCTSSQRGNIFVLSCF